MGLRINTNVAAMNAHRHLTANDNNLGKSLEKLSSGLRINRASDDAAGLAISEKMRSQIGGLNMAAKNALDSVSLLQTAEGAMQETTVILQRMRELAVQAANDTMTTGDRLNLQAEISQLSAEVDRIANTTEFNTKNLLNGNLAIGGLTFQIGANAGQVINVTIATVTAAALTVGSGQVDISTANLASGTIATLDIAINQVTTQRANLGAVINRLEHTISNLNVQSENLSAAESRIRDLDMAKEVANMSKVQILQQSSTAMLAQANQSSQAVLSLLRG